MNDMMFYGYHGVLQEEKILGQKFIVSVELSLDFKQAGMNDSVADTVSYAEVYYIVREIVEDNKFDLIEKLAEEISSGILTKFNKVQELKVKILKPEAPVQGIYGSFGVEICRQR